MIDLDDVPIFILTYGRANEQTSLQTLYKSRIKDNIYLIVSDDDPELQIYKEKYEHILKIFNRNDIHEDMMDNRPQKSGVISARNFCFEFAKKLNAKYFIMLDDDYDVFSFRYVDGKQLRQTKIKDVSSMFVASLILLENTQLDCFCWAQGGDFIGGLGSSIVKHQFKRKAMNIYFWKTESDIRFPGRINEDTNMYVHYGKIGKLLLTNSFMMINQPKTQETQNGMTNLYNDSGTYLKSMYSVIEEPAIVSLMAMGDKHLRIHHKIDWNACTPKIINKKYKK